MPVKLELNISDESYEAFRELIRTNRATILQQLPVLQEALDKELDINKQDNIRTYQAQIMLQLAIITEIGNSLPEKPRIIVPK